MNKKDRGSVISKIIDWRSFVTVNCNYLAALSFLNLAKNPFFLGAGASREPRIPFTPTM